MTDRDGHERGCEYQRTGTGDCYCPGPISPQFDEANPYLPAPPADGRHDWGNHNSYRCMACGVYNRPDVPSTKEVLDAPCEGRWAQSGKLRHAAQKRWAEVQRRSAEAEAITAADPVGLPPQGNLGMHFNGPEEDNPISPYLPPLMAGVYRHYKGHFYQVLGYAHDANADHSSMGLWRRPAEHWKPEPIGERFVVVYIGLETQEAHRGPRLAVRDVDDFRFQHMHFDSNETWIECHVDCDGLLDHEPRFKYLGSGL